VRASRILRPLSNISQGSPCRGECLGGNSGTVIRVAWRCRLTRRWGCFFCRGSRSVAIRARSAAAA
jgi:hypothetical protein